MWLLFWGMNGHPSPGFSPRQTFVSARHASCTKLPLCSRCPTIVNSSQIFPCSIVNSVSLFLSVRHLTRFSAEKEKKKTTEKCLDRHVVSPSFFRPGGNSGGFSPPSISLLLLPKRGKKLEKHSSDRPLGPAIDFFFFPGVNKKNKGYFLDFFFANFLRSRSPPSSVIGRVIFPRFKSGEIGLCGEKGCVSVWRSAGPTLACR